MAIVKMAKAIVACPKEDFEKLLDVLQKTGTLHIRSFQGPEKTEVDYKTIKDRLALAASANNIIGTLFPKKLPFTANFSWPRPVTPNEKYQKMVSEFDAEGFSKNVIALHDVMTKLSEEKAKLEAEIKDLKKYQNIPYSCKLPSSLNVIYELGFISKAKLKRAQSTSFADSMAIENVSGNIYLVCRVKNHDAETKKFLSKVRFEPITLPESEKTVKQIIDEDTMAANERAEKILQIKETLKTEYAPQRLSLAASIDELESSELFLVAKEKAWESGHAILTIGYLPASKTSAFERAIKASVPSASVLLLEVPDDEEPPVALKNSVYTAPFEMVTSMYGLPSYRGFDSTPIVSVIFPIFFGFCFGDVFYGLMLLGFSFWYLRTFKTEPGGKRFFYTFIWCSVATIIAGALTGSWGGNLIASDGVITWAPLVSFKDSLMIIDPLKKTIVFFVATLFIGVLSQFLGIGMAAYGNIKKGQIADALLDQGSWFVFLSGLIMFVADFLGANFQGTLKVAMYSLLIAGAGMLVLFQGRSSKNFVGRIGTGLVSLYGVMGGYGSATFIADVMSYSRLMALGLTTSIVAMAFNKMALMAGFGGFMAPLAILILIVGHIFNFFLNIIGCFVHAARLTFLEFYSRFYSGGGTEYKPFSKSRKRINVAEEA